MTLSNTPGRKSRGHLASAQTPVHVTSSNRAAVTRKLNDELRRAGTGGRTVMTAGVAALPAAMQAQILDAVAFFHSFDANNDPYGEHDFGMITVAGERVAFKIDYYDPAMAMHSPDPADPAVTCRVLTIMLAVDC